MDIRQSVFNKKSQQSTAAKQETTFNQKTTASQGAAGTAKQGSIHVFTQKRIVMWVFDFEITIVV